MTLADARLELEVPIEPYYGHEVRSQVLAFTGRHAIPEHRLADFLTALGEALANAFEHSRARSVAIEVHLTPSHIVAVIRDLGVGFSSAALAEALPDPNAERGRGLPIMRRCCDVFHIASVPGQGTAVVVGCALGRGEADPP